jgi:quinol monooxygenase YgiN
MSADAGAIWGMEAGPMLIVAGTIEVEPDDRDALMAAALPMMAASQAEEGCLDYVFSVDPTDAGTVRVFERWTDAAALEAHFATAHMATLRAAMGPLRITRSDVTRYAISRTGPVRG